MKVKNNSVPWLFALFVLKWYQYVWEFPVIFPQFNKYYWNDSLNGIFDVWKETFPHETYILEKLIAIMCKSFFFPPKGCCS